MTRHTNARSEAFKPHQTKPTLDGKRCATLRDPHTPSPKPGMYGNPPLTLCSKASWTVRTALRIVGEESRLTIEPFSESRLRTMSRGSQL